MSDTIIDRIRTLYKKECGSIPKFAKVLGISSDTLKNVISRGVAPNYDILHSIAIAFPHYSMDWLIAGVGSMNKDEEKDILSENEVDVDKKVEFLEARIKDLEQTIASKDQTIEAMQLLIDTLRNR
ncbi:hypothetical protein [Dysgonomonas sp. 511]|uniref:hypothetical protein n=1 Tax=Dysgonomonas sp. 511 TaxID=2302930 RepID=UPI0013CF4110|nr:hypothetical protein [Dysgonomonas sp. 511]